MSESTASTTFDEPNTSSDEPEPELTKTAQRWLDQERDAYLAANSGDFGRAVALWQEILDTEESRTFFGEEEGQLDEIAAGLADAYLQVGNAAKAQELIETWQLEQADESPADSPATTE